MGFSEELFQYQITITFYGTFCAVEHHSLILPVFSAGVGFCWYFSEWGGWEPELAPAQRAKVEQSRC